MLKLIGAAMILFSGAMIGYYQSLQLSSRPRQIRQFILALKRLETEISYGFSPLAEAFVNIGRIVPPPVSLLFRKLAEELQSGEEITVKEVWQRVFSAHWQMTACKKNEKDIMLLLGASLGVSDREDQLRYLRLAIAQLQAEEENAIEEQKRYEKMWRSLGVLAGALIVIVMY
jgi:stage III sporulation protein AB